MRDRIMDDYAGFEGATDMYYEKAEHMDAVMAVFDKNVVNLQTVMSRINDGIGNISAVVEERTGRKPCNRECIRACSFNCKYQRTCC